MASDDSTFSSEPTIDGPQDSAAAAIMAAHLSEGPGSRIGPYRILQLIGEGGFGSVFLAQQEQPVQRRVALKIIKLGMDTRRVVARFEQERQALAMMDHPNIARVLDAGATETGRPYFVMELVKGDPIVEYCDKHNLSIRERLDLFAQVCTAVQHAHTKGIIHRDLKPSNILVSMQDGVPSPKVIDFGIAKATSTQLTDKTIFTEHRQLIGTPEYMSPEQAEGSLDIDTRTDVYSLGVLLYELLTGTTPFSTKELRSASHEEVQRIIREVDPPVPSTRISRNSDTIISIAAKRQTEPRRLGSTIRGELDWIAMKAMEKDRQRRYETANGLAADIRRYLAGEAVVAAPASAAYRVRKFVKRHRVMVIAGAVVTAALVLGVIGTSIGLLEANTQRRLAEKNAERATEEANRATKAENVAQSRLAESEATVTFLDEMLGAADPNAQGKDVTVRTVLDNASKTVGEKFAARPLVSARLHGTIGRTYVSLGAYEPAELHLREQLRIRREKLGAEHEDTCRAVNDLGIFLTKMGKQAESQALLKIALAEHTRLFGRQNPITLQTMDALAASYVEQMRSAEAEPLLREVLDIRKATSGADNTETVSSMNGLATLYADTGRFDESEKLFEEASQIQERLSGRDHPLTLEVRSNLAWLEYWAAMQEKTSNPENSKRRIARARAIGEEVFEAKKRVLGEEHQSTLATMSNLASVYKQLGMLDEAEALARKDLEIISRVLGEDHPDTIVSLANLGAQLRSRDRCAEALPYLERAIRGSRKMLPPDHEGTGFALGWYASCLSSLGRFAEAEPAMLEGRAIVAKKMGETNEITIQMTKDIVKLYQDWEKADPAAGHAAKAAEWMKALESAEASLKPASR
ncbi:MAG: serine/threonine protein kinase [Phycisphaeraceae bacterium]|nr:serine/threonine protein kinase [Phycisphaeraceae bacterium]